MMKLAAMVAVVVTATACGVADPGGAPDVAADTSPKVDDPRADASDVVPGADVAADIAPDIAADIAADIAPDIAADTATDIGDPASQPWPKTIIDGLVRSVDGQFWYHMDDFVFRRLAGSGVRLYVAVQNANHYAQAPYRAYGAELVRHPESFFENALGPFVDRYASALWAIDCMNEPEAMTQGSDGNYATWGVTWDEMRDYLRKCAAVVHAHGGGHVQVSAGSGWHDWHNLEKGHYEGLGFDFLDAHVYLDDWDSPPAESLSSLPVIIGECGQKTEVRDDERQVAATRSCFQQASAGGYRAALAWFYDHVGSTSFLAAKNADGSWRPFSGLFAEYDQTGAGPLTTGLNLAWLGGAYDHDFAPNPLHPEWGVAYSEGEAMAVIADYAAHGIGLMRLWAFEGQEGLPFSSLISGFETSVDGFGPIDPAHSSVALNTAEPFRSGAQTLQIRVANPAPSWQGVMRTWSADMPLNIAHAFTFQYRVSQALDTAVGVNLFFVVDTAPAGSPEALVTYQTREAAQSWLPVGGAGYANVHFAPDEFADNWALDSAPEVGAPRPSDAQLERVRAVGVRFYCNGPCSGTVDFDDFQIY